MTQLPCITLPRTMHVPCQKHCHPTTELVNQFYKYSLKLGIALIPFIHKINRVDCGYQVHGTGRKSYLLYMDDLKLLARSEDFKK
jgi:hypothetical protein